MSATAPVRPLPIIGWLIVALVAFSLTALSLALREPAESLLLPTLRCELRSATGALIRPEAPVSLPYLAPTADMPARLGTHCRAEIDLPAGQTRDLALFTPAFIDTLRVDLNGQRMAMNELYLMRNLRFATLPAFIALPNELLREGRNHLQFTLSAPLGRQAALDRMFVGPAHALRPHFHARWFASAVLPTLVVGGGIAFALIFALLWTIRPAEREFGWLSATLLLGTLRGTVLIPDFGINLADRPVWNLLVVWEVTTALMFCRAVARAPRLRFGWLWSVPPLIISLVFLFGPAPTLRDVLIRATIAMTACYLTLAIASLGRAAKAGSQDALIVLLGVVAVCAFATRDVVMLLNPGPNLVFLTRTVYGGFLIAVALLMTLRFVRAMRDLDNTAAILRDRVAATQAELHATYEELRARREAEAVDRERARLMRDLHDGLGGNLASMLALAAPQPGAQEIARHARAALTDMRLIISSLEDYGGDLAIALAAWRERAEPQLRAAGITLRWAIRELPPIAGLGPTQTLDILRIVQEAMANVVQHAQASHVTLAAADTADGIVLTIRDDGVGTPGGARHEGGHGIANMRARAARLGARLEIDHAPHGTCVRLALPHTFKP